MTNILLLKTKDIGLKKLFFNHKMQTSAEVMEILKENELRGYVHNTKSKFIDLLIKRSLLPKKCGTNKQEKAKKKIDPKYNSPHSKDG